MQVQLMQFQPLTIQSFTMSTARNFILRLFQPITLQPIYPQIIIKTFIVITNAKKQVEQLIFYTMKSVNYLEWFVV